VRTDEENMMRRLMTVLVLLAVLAGCGGDDSGTDETPPAEEGDAQAACIAEWDAFVDEWNELTTERDEAGAEAVVVDGETFDSWEQYAEMKGYPLSYEEHCDS
jgi:hypothetical protein